MTSSASPRKLRPPSAEVTAPTHCSFREFLKKRHNTWERSCSESPHGSMVKYRAAVPIMRRIRPPVNRTRSDVTSSIHAMLPLLPLLLLLLRPLLPPPLPPLPPATLAGGGGGARDDSSGSNGTRRVHAVLVLIQAEHQRVELPPGPQTGSKIVRCSRSRAHATRQHCSCCFAKPMPG